MPKANSRPTPIVTETEGELLAKWLRTQQEALEQLEQRLARLEERADVLNEEVSLVRTGLNKASMFLQRQVAPALRTGSR